MVQSFRRATVSTQDLPGLLADNGVSDCYLDGLVRAVLDSLQLRLDPR